MKIIIIVLMLTTLTLGSLIVALWPKPVDPPEILTLLIWGKPNEDAGTVQWIHGRANQEQALRWKVWQPSGYVLKHRFVIEGKVIND